MTGVTLVFIGIIILFTALILLRSAFSFKICALCGAASLTWITLLVLFYANYSIDPIVLTLLMGGSIVGSMYVLERRLPKKYQLFKLPYFLTGIYVAHLVLTRIMYIEVVYLLLAVWLFAVVIHTGKQIESLKTVGRKIIECCKNW